MPEVVRPFILPKDHEVMPRLALTGLLCSPRAMMACHARRPPIVCAVQGRDGMHLPMLSDAIFYPRRMMDLMPDIVRTYGLHKGDYVKPHPRLQ